MKFIDHFIKIFKNHYLSIILFSIVSIVVISIAIAKDKWYESLVYLFTIGCSFLIIEFIYFKKRPSNEMWKIKNPKIETYVIIFCVSVTILLGILRFIVIEDFNSLNIIINIAIKIAALLFIYPILLFIYFKILKKYKFKEIGFSIKYFWIAIPVIICFGLISNFLLPEQVQFTDTIQKHGVLALITLGFLTAAIPEEFTRMLFQTRLSRILKNKGVGWFIASSIWALAHIPIFYNQSSSFYDAFITSIGILPIGLFWGYLTERSKSIIPSILIHGTNLWGLQNIF